MTKHTPGPWYKQETGYEYAIPKRHYVTDGGRRCVAEMTEHSPEANARLIAAAPELLDFAQNVIALFDRTGKLDKSWGPDAECVNRLREAIAKAEGKS